MNIIFLDVDGELTYSDYSNDKTFDIDVEKVKLLKLLCDKTNAKVVISSSWRGSNGYTPKCYYFLVDLLSSYNINVIDKLPNIPIILEDNIQNKSTFSLDGLSNIKAKFGTGRAAEIQLWLSTHTNIDNFVILDDEDYEWREYGYDKHWIQPTYYGDGGLKIEHVNKAIQILLNRKDNCYDIS